MQGVVVGLGEWECIQKKASEYVERKWEEGRWSAAGSKGESGVPMLDLLDGRELIR
jgi:hypothetical protein